MKGSSLMYSVISGVRDRFAARIDLVIVGDSYKVQWCELDDFVVGTTLYLYAVVSFCRVLALRCIYFFDETSQKRCASTLYKRNVSCRSMQRYIDA